MTSNNEQVFTFGKNIEMIFVDEQTKMLDELIAQEERYLDYKACELQKCKERLQKFRNWRKKYIRQQLDKLVTIEKENKNVKKETKQARIYERGK